MKCLQCTSDGHRSTVEVGMSVVTTMGVHAYYDEDGHYHYDDPNTATTEYTCSRGHRWTETTGRTQFSSAVLPPPAAPPSGDAVH